jgi:MATE family multidrug resistance protein
MVIIVNSLATLTMIPFGSMIAGAVFVGKSMGEGSGKRALIYTKLITLYTFLSLIIVCTLLIVFRYDVATFFTDQPELIQMVGDNYCWMALFLMIHGVGLSLAGALRGMGK